MNTNISDKPLVGLEILRFAAAFAVVVWHYKFFFFSPSDMRQLPFYGALTIFYTAGLYAVPWFWTLSGYIFFWNYESSIAKRFTSAAEFSVLRFSRLYPLHLLTLLLVTSLQIIHLSQYGTLWHYVEDFNPVMFVAQLLFASNWFTFAYTFNGPIWSISIEVLVYAIFFALARSAALRTAPRTAAVTLIFLSGYWAANRLIPTTSLQWLLQCAICFFLGGLLVKCRDVFRSTLVLSLALILGSAALAIFRPTYAWTFALPALGVFLFSTEVLWQHPIARHAAKLGNLTYASYLLHFPIALTIVLVLKGAHISLEVALSPWFFVAYFVAVFGISHLSFNFFERPMQSLLRRRLLLHAIQKPA